MRLYERALAAETDEGTTDYTCTDDTHPRHALLAKLAQLYRTGDPLLQKSAEKAGALPSINRNQ